MLSPYRRVLSKPGALAFSMSGLVARMPMSMVTLGIVLLVSTRSGSYGLAGGVSAAFIITTGVFAIIQARLIDRHGQSRVLPWTISIFAAALAMMMVSVEAGWPTPVPHLFAAVAGGSFPQIGSSVRARWSYVLSDKRLLQTAFAFEAVVDESVFVIGPTLVTFLATVVHPLAGLATAILAAVLGTFALVSQRATEPPVSPPRPGRSPRGSMPWAILAPLVASAFTMGVLFGGTEVATVAFADELGAKAVSGPLLATWATGSLLAGLVTGAVQIRASNPTRFRWGLLSLALTMVPLPFLGGFVVMGLFLFLGGFAISPTLIASVAWIEESVPSGRLTEGMSVFTTALVAGIAPGAAVVGMVVDRYGASASYWVPAVAGLVGAAIAFGTAWATKVTPPAASSPSGSSG